MMHMDGTATETIRTKRNNFFDWNSMFCNCHANCEFEIPTKYSRAEKLRQKLAK